MNVCCNLSRAYFFFPKICLPWLMNDRLKFAQSLKLPWNWLKIFRRSFVCTAKIVFLRGHFEIVLEVHISILLYVTNVASASGNEKKECTFSLRLLPGFACNSDTSIYNGGGCRLAVYDIVQPLISSRIRALRLLIAI